MLYFVLSGSIVALTFCYLIRVAAGLQRLRTKSIAALLEGMSYVDLARVSLVARASHSHQNDEPCSAEDLTLLIGGPEGLQKLLRNAAAMLQIARYLTVIRPEAHALTQQIRQDATRVRRIVIVLLVRHKFDLWCLSNPLTVRGLARLYLALSVYTTQICVHLSDDLMLILQGWASGHAHLARALSTSSANRIGDQMYCEAPLVSR